MTCVVRDRNSGADAAARTGAGECQPVHVAPSACGVSPGLLAAALGGLLCLSACGSDENAVQPGQGDAATEGQQPDASAVFGDAGDASGGEDAATGQPADASSGDNPADAEAAEPTPHITLSRVDASITEESFRKQCEELSGKIELHPSCGGKNSCRGMSYDLDTHVYTEHTCKALNTCRGFSCVLPEPA